MDFTDLNQTAREATLESGEVLALLRFSNFQREREIEDRWGEVYERLCERAAAIYPRLTFKQVDYRIFVRVQDDVPGSLVEHFGFVSKLTPHLTATVLFGFESVRAVFRADGIGIIKEDSWYEFFEHDLDLAKIRADCKDDEVAISDHLNDYFHEQVNPQMEDPFFDPNCEDCPLYFETGSQEELDRVMKLFILTEPEIETHADEEVRLYAATEGNAPELDDEGGYSSERLSQLVAQACAENQPVGWTWEYNDGPHYRQSGYYESAEALTWSIGEILEESSARAKMAARRELRRYLAARGIDPTQFCAPAQERMVA